MQFFHRPKLRLFRPKLADTPPKQSFKFEPADHSGKKSCRSGAEVRSQMEKNAQLGGAYGVRLEKNPKL